MVEIALCIAIVSIAMVAIMGVMPMGLSVQKQNREDTIIDQDAQLLIEAIRGGAVRLNELTQYVDYITVSHQPTNSGAAATLNAFKGLVFEWSPSLKLQIYDRGQLDRSEDIIGLLSLPRLDVYRDKFGTNTVVAQMRSFSGPLNEKVRPWPDVETDPKKLDFAFRYQVTSEVYLLPAGPENGAPFVSRDFTQRPVFDVRLTFRWPVYLAGDTYQVGNSRKSYRTQVTGQLQEYRIPGERTAEIFDSKILRRRFGTSSLVLQ
jgi:hypothetical protein